jgi:hypothetical protein
LALDRPALIDVVKDVAPMMVGGFLYPFSELAARIEMPDSALPFFRPPLSGSNMKVYSRKITPQLICIGTCQAINSFANDYLEWAMAAHMPSAEICAWLENHASAVYGRPSPIRVSVQEFCRISARRS